MHRTTLGPPGSRPAARTWQAVFAFLVAVAWSAPSAAQELSPSLPSGADTTEVTPQAPLPQPPAAVKPHVVRWWEAAVVAGGVGALLADDRHVAHDVREHPTSGAADVADVFRQAGDIKVYTALTLGTLGAGLLAKNAGITRTGAQLAASGALGAASFGLLKVLTGRLRPDVGEGAYEFHPFAGGGSFPSGHAAMAFALATTLGDASHSTWVTAGLYVIATGTAWSRVYDERHWPSDVFLGAALGVTSAKVVNGRWRIFGIHPPRLLLSPRGVSSLGWQTAFLLGDRSRDQRRRRSNRSPRLLLGWTRDSSPCTRRSAASRGPPSAWPRCPLEFLAFEAELARLQRPLHRGAGGSGRSQRGVGRDRRINHC